VFERKMQALTAKDGTPTGSMVFKKARARAFIKGCNQIRRQSFDPLAISAPVCHVAVKHLYLVNITIVNFGLVTRYFQD
jgi:hypothetical protein